MYKIKNKKLRVSAGILVIWKNQVLLAKPAKSKNFCDWTPPKGKVDKNESIEQGAIREFKEEIGILLDENKLIDPFQILFKQKKKLYKKVVFYKYFIQDLSEINLSNAIVPVEQLEQSEIHSAKFVSIHDIETYVTPKYQEIVLDMVNNLSAI
jgi:ADP-ribose pyrophosphatase YjhB (NUDIX family)